MPKLTVGRFITVEGVDGSGKTTMLPHIQEIVESKGYTTVLTREPGGCEVAEQIRAIFLSSEITPTCELLLIFAARVEHIHRVIKPALHQGYWVICDRFIDASYAYQGDGGGLGEECVQMLDTAFVSCRPDLTFLLDVPLHTSLARIQQRRTYNRFDSADIEFLQRVIHGYKKRAAQNPQRIQVIDATQSPENIKGRMAALLDIACESWNPHF
jgi:dTMP kinase